MNQHNESAPHASGACANCGTTAAGTYCHACGQRIETHRLTLPHLLHEIPHAVFHVDRGLLVTIGALARHPGRTINDYLDGRRVRYFNPLSMLVILAGICALVYAKFPFDFDLFGSDLPPQVAEFARKINKTMFVNYSLVSLLSLPLQALFSWWLLRKHGRRSYGEHLVIHAFIQSFCCLINLFLLPLYMILNGTHAYRVLLQWNSLLFVAYSTVALWAVFAPYRTRFSGIVRSVVSVCAPYFLVSLLSAGSMIVYMMMNPELLQQMQR